MASSFSANSVLSTYRFSESMLSEVLEVVPYCPEHEGVWSPRLATIVLDVCSQLDSLWKYEARQSPYVSKPQLNIKDYFEYYGKQVAPRWLVFWAEEPLRLQPFVRWANLSGYTRDDYEKLEWWGAYNKLKHDRYRNCTYATLAISVSALAGLFLSILRYEGCRAALAQSGWLAGNDSEPAAWLGEDSSSTKDKYVTVETGLFSYPVGWAGVRVLPQMKWMGPASRRFQDWFDSYHTE